jgi:hypothetical protein
MEGYLACSRCIGFSATLLMLDSLFLKCHPTSPKDKSQMFTLSLELSTLVFILLFGHHLLWGRQIFTKDRARKHSAGHTI